MCHACLDACVTHVSRQDSHRRGKSQEKNTVAADARDQDFSSLLPASRLQVLLLLL